MSPETETGHIFLKVLACQEEKIDAQEGNTQRIASGISLTKLA
jgi:hypothetical protein